VLRFLKIITPVKCVERLYDGHIVQPEKGELHRRYTQNRILTAELDPPVWSVDIDEQESVMARVGVMARGLQLLWDI
jgi:hypothetical protein